MPLGTPALILQHAAMVDAVQTINVSQQVLLSLLFEYSLICAGL